MEESTIEFLKLCVSAGALFLALIAAVVGYLEYKRERELTIDAGPP